MFIKLYFRRMIYMKKKIFTAALAAAVAMATAPAVLAVEQTDAITGDLNVTDFFGAKTDAVQLNDGESVTFKFNNKSNGTNNWDNFVMCVTGEVGEAYTGADQEILVVRADNWGWGGGYSDFVAPDASGNKLNFETDINWDLWADECQNGMDVEITVSKEGNTLAYNAKIGEYTDKLTATSGVDLPGSVYIFFTGENCDLTGFSTSKGGANQEDINNQTQAGLKVVDSLSGDLNVASFFGSKTDAVQLNNGESITFDFNAKSNGSNNYENFILGVTGAAGEEYTGADQEVLVLRADAWGWGGGMSDFVAPDAEGNKLAFESDVNWDEWQAGAQNGYKVTATLSKDGDKLTYNAKIGDYTVKSTAVSGKSLPDSLYVFLTGENCDITGISTSKGGAQENNTESKAANSSSKASTTTSSKASTTTTTTTSKASDATANSSAAESDNTKTGNSVAGGFVAVALTAAAAVVLRKKK